MTISLKLLLYSIYSLFHIIALNWLSKIQVKLLISATTCKQNKPNHYGLLSCHEPSDFSAFQMCWWVGGYFIGNLSVFTLYVNPAKMATLTAQNGTRKPVKSVHSGLRKHTERFGCNSHIGQLNATTSALSLSFAYGIHMLMMSLVFFLACVNVHVCLCVRTVFSLMCFFSPCTSSPPPILFVLPNKKRCRKFGFILPLLRQKKIQIHPSYFHFLSPDD